FSVVSAFQLFTATGHISDGSTWHFRAWYRDLNGTLGTQVGVVYDLVVDFDQSGTLSAGDMIDGLIDEAGSYVVRDAAPSVAGLPRGRQWARPDKHHRVSLRVREPW
ncbi:MAG: hypothetical protein ACI835_000896, partial [Planctomycetota bacterium]